MLSLIKDNELDNGQWMVELIIMELSCLSSSKVWSIRTKLLEKTTDLCP